MATQINYKQIQAEADLYKYQIVPSISSWNLTVALKNYLWQDPSITTPVKVQIWDTVRTITWPLNIIINAWNNQYNAWSSELATKEIDIFTYLVYDTTLSKVWLLTSRIPGATKFWDFSTNWTNEKWMSISQNVNPSSTDTVINIWRFSAILSAGAWYTWSTPSAWFQVINHYINETKSLQSLWMAYPETGALGNCLSDINYKLIWNKMFFSWYVNVINKWTWWGVIFVNLPFNSNENHSAAIWNWRTEWWANWWKMISLKNIAYNKNCAIFTYDSQGTISNWTVNDFNWFTNI